MKSIAKIGAALSLIGILSCSSTKHDPPPELRYVAKCIYVDETNKDFKVLRDGYIVNSDVLREAYDISEILLFRAYPQAGGNPIPTRRKIYERDGHVKKMREFVFGQITKNDSDRIITLAEFNEVKEDFYDSVGVLIESTPDIDFNKYEGYGDYGEYFIPKGESQFVDFIIRQTIKNKKKFKNYKNADKNNLKNKILQDISRKDYEISTLDLIAYTQENHNSLKLSSVR